VDGPKARRLKLARNLAVILLGALLILLAWAYISFKRIPDWYRPVHVSPAQHQQIRDEITETGMVLNNKMQRVEPFLFEITDQQINRWLNGLEALDPQLEYVMPSSVESPVVAFRDGKISVGALLHLDGQRTVANLTVRIVLFEDKIALEELALRAGQLTLPRSFLVDRLKQFVEQQDPQLRRTLVAILEGQAIENRFRFPNSDYDFRITSVKITDGRLQVGIQPLLP